MVAEHYTKDDEWHCLLENETGSLTCSRKNERKFRPGSRQHPAKFHPANFGFTGSYGVKPKLNAGCEEKKCQQKVSVGCGL